MPQRRASHPGRHIIAPASGDEIIRTLGIGKADRKAVDVILAHEKDAPKGTSSKRIPANSSQSGRHAPKSRSAA